MDDIHEIPNLFTHDDFGRNRLKSFLETNESPAKAFRDHANSSNEAALSREGFLSLAGYDNQLNSLDKHSTLPDDVYDVPLLGKDVVEQVLSKYDQNVSLGMQSKDIKNGYGFIRSGFNAPRAADLPDGHKDHYITMDGKMRGLSHTKTKTSRSRWTGVRYPGRGAVAPRRRKDEYSGAKNGYSGAVRWVAYISHPTRTEVTNEPFADTQQIWCI